MYLELAALDLLLRELPGPRRNLMTNCIVFRDWLTNIYVLLSLCLKRLLRGHLISKMERQSYHPLESVEVLGEPCLFIDDGAYRINSCEDRLSV